MLDTLPVGRSRIEGSFWWIFLSAVAAVQAEAAIWVRQALENSFADTATGDYLDLIAARYGLTRRAAVAATGTITFHGVEDVEIDAGVLVGKDAGVGQPPITYETGTYGTIPHSGLLTLPIVALVPGTASHAAIGEVNRLLTPIAGVISVTNAVPVAGGIDTESDVLLRTRIALRAANPASSGTAADYQRWALEVPGVGAVSVSPLANGPGTVGIYVVGLDGAPAEPEVVAAVQAHIDPVDTFTQQVEGGDWFTEGAGASVDNTLLDDTGDSIKLAYNVAGTCRVKSLTFWQSLTAPGVWTMKARVKASTDLSVVDMVRILVWNTTQGGYARTAPSVDPVVDATTVYSAADIGADGWTLLEQDFYWNGIDQLDARIARDAVESGINVWVDQVTFTSRFGSIGGLALSPIGASVTVYPAISTPVFIHYRLIYRATYDEVAVRAAVLTNLLAYLGRTSFATDPVDRVIRYHEIGEIIMATPGVLDYSDLEVNDRTDSDANVTLAPGQVAVLTAVNLMSWDEFDALGLTWDQLDAEARTWNVLGGLVE